MAESAVLMISFPFHLITSTSIDAYKIRAGNEFRTASEAASRVAMVTARPPTAPHCAVRRCIRPLGCVRKTGSESELREAARGRGL